MVWIVHKQKQISHFNVKISADLANKEKVKQCEKQITLQ
jgi:hypothetical protein